MRVMPDGRSILFFVGGLSAFAVGVFIAGQSKFLRERLALQFLFLVCFNFAVLGIIRLFY